MCMQNRLKRYLIFLIGLVICAFGVVFTTKAALGTSPISAIPYTLSLTAGGLTFGNWVIAYQLVMILVELLLLRRRAKADEMIVQVVIAFTYGYLVDLFMLVMDGFAPAAYLLKLLSLVVGCAFMALGIAVELAADVAMISYDAFVRVIAQSLKRDYGKVRTVADISNVVIAALIGLVCTGTLLGVREGTVIGAFLVGPMVHFFSTKLHGVANRLLIHKKRPPT